MEIVLVKAVIVMMAAVAKLRAGRRQGPSLVLETERYLWRVAHHEARLREGRAARE